MLVEINTVDSIVGLLFVLFYSADNFNTPATNRSSTTAGRYFLALSIYCLSATLAYVTLINFPHLLAFFMGASPSDGAGPVVPDALKGLSLPLIVALLMTALLPRLPLLGKLDTWICDQLQRLAEIPTEVLRLSAELRRQPFEIPPTEQAAVREKLLGEGFDEADIHFGASESPMSAWTALTALFVRLEAWNSDRRMSGYLHDYGAHFGKLREQRAALIPRARFWFEAVRMNAAREEAVTARDFARKAGADFSAQITRLREDLLDFISRGILHAELTDTSRKRRLERLGFLEHPAPTAFTLNQLLCVFGVVAMLLLSGFVLVDMEANVGRAIMRTCMIAAIYCVAVSCAVVPREKWEMAKRKPGERPVAFYLVAGVMAVGFSLLISFFFNCIFERGVGAGWRRSAFTYPWAAMTFATTVLTAFLIDDRPSSRIRRRAWRLIEGAGAATVLLGVSWLTHEWLDDLATAPGAIVPVGYLVPPILMVMIMAGAIGFAIGYLVPTWYREAPRASRREPDAASVAGLQGAAASGA